MKKVLLMYQLIIVKAILPRCVVIFCHQSYQAIEFYCTAYRINDLTQYLRTKNVISRSVPFRVRIIIPIFSRAHTGASQSQVSRIRNSNQRDGVAAIPFKISMNMKFVKELVQICIEMYQNFEFGLGLNFGQSSLSKLNKLVSVCRIVPLKILC